MNSLSDSPNNLWYRASKDKLEWTKDPVGYKKDDMGVSPFLLDKVRKEVENRRRQRAPWKKGPSTTELVFGTRTKNDYDNKSKYDEKECDNMNGSDNASVFPEPGAKSVLFSAEDERKKNLKRIMIVAGIGLVAYLFFSTTGMN